MKLLYAVGSNSGSVRNGLRVIEIDDETGRFREVSRVADSAFPIYFDRSADGRFLYAAELHDGKGCVSVFQVSGVELTRLQVVPCAETVPCHLSLSPDGRFLVWAEYRNAWTGVCAVDAATGLLSAPLDRHHHTGKGPNEVRQESAHCHFAKVEDGVVHVCDLGIDTVVAYRLADDGKMVPAPELDLHVAPGSGPRHLAFHPNGKWAYLVNELVSTVLPLRLEGPSLVPMSGQLSMLPPDFRDATKAAAIRISPDGTQLVASNRGHDSLAVFDIDPKDGSLSLRSIQRLGGSFPRDFIFLPNGKFLLVAHKMSHEFATYAYDAATGSLRLVQRSAKLTQPLAFCLLGCAH